MGFERARNDEQKNIRMKQITDSARHLFENNKYENITLAGIARELSFTRANLYKYVASKEEVFLNIIIEDITKWNDDIMNRFKKSEKTTKEKFAEIWTQSFVDHSHMIKAMSIMYSVIEKNITANQTSALAEELNSILSDIKYLKEAFQISMDKNEEYETVAAEWQVFSKNKRIYNQIRYIDESGEEVIRVNYSDNNAYIVENEYLQNKSDRYYFKDSVNLDKNTIYISPFDLNIENGMVEVPIKPMIRFLTPVYNNLGEVKGVIILNYLAHNVLDKITDNLPNNEGEINLVNEDGYWLYSGDSEQDWGFMYPKKNNISFKASYPDEWSGMASGENEIVTSNGLFISKEITLANEVIDESKNKLVFGKGTWIVVSHIEKDNPNSYYFLPGFWSIVGKTLIDNYFVFILILVFSIIFAYLYLRNRFSFNQIKFFSEYDDMTDSYNRRVGLLILKRKILALKSEDDVITICFLDVNGLKKVNDGLGHNFGDELLETIAATIKKEIRDKDILARLGEMSSCWFLME